jgi:hypothetical protein
VLLEGSIQRFKLAHVLQLLAHTGATGMLEIRGAEEYGFIYLVNGRVEGVSLPLNDQKLGMRLLQAGYVTEQELAESLADGLSLAPEQRDGVPLGQRLVERGFTTEERVREIVRRQASDWLFELVQWPSGLFIYTEPDEMPEFQVQIQADLKDLLREANQRIAETGRTVKKQTGQTHQLCVVCPVASECSDEIKDRYLKKDVCLWRSMSGLVDDEEYAGLRRHHDPQPSVARDPRSKLDSSLSW